MSRADEKRRVQDAQSAVVSGGTSIDEVPDIPEGEPFAEEWRAFKREVFRLVNDGMIGKFAVLKGEQLVGIWDTLSDAELAGRRQFGDAPFLVQEIQLHLKPMCRGYFRPSKFAASRDAASGTEKP
jgi:hypothetical protein